MLSLAKMCSGPPAVLFRMRTSLMKPPDPPSAGWKWHAPQARLLKMGPSTGRVSTSVKSNCPSANSCRFLVLPRAAWLTTSRSGSPKPERFGTAMSNCASACATVTITIAVAQAAAMSIFSTLIRCSSPAVRPPPRARGLPNRCGNRASSREHGLRRALRDHRGFRLRGLRLRRHGERCGQGQMPASFELGPRRSCRPSAGLGTTLVAPRAFGVATARR